MKKQNPKNIHQKELDTLIRFSSIINSSLKIEDVLNYAMQWVEEFMSAEASTVYELDEDKGEIFIRIARGKKKEPVKRIKLKLGEGIAGGVIQTGKSVVMQDVNTEKKFSNKFDTKTGFETRSMLCVPLILRDKPIGALQVLNKRSGETFTDADLELLTSISQQIAVALDNAKLYRRLEKKFELTEQELKTTQEKLIRTERLAAMGNLVKGIAHEIRNPITTIGGFSSRLKKELKEESKLRKYVDIIIEESKRLENIVTEVHEFAGVQSANMNLDDLGAVLGQVATEFGEQAKKQDVKFMVKIDKDLPLTFMDTSQIAKAFSNIIENALESMPHGGKLTLEAKLDNDNIVTSIRDTGCGIASEDLDAVYDPFFTSKTRGAGLGLTMVHQIVMNHNGELKFDSKEGVGTTVTIRLPVIQQGTRPSLH
ncbi:MAG: GAF domain-containing protein [Deltaproteobacteria bacterium]|nr:GAF domain-containing protein [Deltaproteobacteria bacterium]